VRKATLVVVLSVLCLAGCTDADWTQVMEFPSPGEPDAPPPPPRSIASEAAAPVHVRGIPRVGLSETCERSAKDRSEEAAWQGFGEAVQAQVHNETYAQCMAWAEAHGD